MQQFVNPYTSSADMDRKDGEVKNNLFFVPSDEKCHTVVKRMISDTLTA